MYDMCYHPRFVFYFSHYFFYFFLSSAFLEFTCFVLCWLGFLLIVPWVACGVKWSVSDASKYLARTTLADFRFHVCMLYNGEEELRR